MSTKLKTLIALTLVLSTIFVAASALANTIYLPVVYNQPTATPTNTLTPTPSPTPTKTPTPGPGVYIIDIEYNPDGDPLDEYVEIENTKNKSVDMTDWRISQDGDTRKFDFPDFTLGSDRKVKVWTKSGTDTSTNLYFDQTEPWWKDHGTNCAYLKDEDRVTVDSYCYGFDYSIYLKFP